MNIKLIKNNVRLKEIQMVIKQLTEREAKLVGEWYSLKKKHQETISLMERNTIKVERNLLRESIRKGTLKLQDLTDEVEQFVFWKAEC